MSLILDTGALIAFETGDRTVRAQLERAQRDGDSVTTTSGAVARACRDGGRPARLALLLRGTIELELTRDRCRSLGRLLGRSGGREVVDASIVDAAVDGDEIRISDPDDIAGLVLGSGKRLLVTVV